LYFINDGGGRRMDGKGRDLLVDIELIWKCRLTCVSKNFKKKLKKKLYILHRFDTLILKIIFKK
jgi:hypothetical protein